MEAKDLKVNSEYVWTGCDPHEKVTYLGKDLDKYFGGYFFKTNNTRLNVSEDYVGEFIKNTNYLK